MPNTNNDGDCNYCGCSSPPETSIKSLLNLYADAENKCGEPGSLPNGYRTDIVSKRCNFPWTANIEDRTLAAVMAVRNMTEEDLKHFREDLEKSAADWKRRQTGHATGGESELGEAENDTEVTMETAERDEARSKRRREAKLWTARTKRISRREQKLIRREWSLDSREQTLTLKGTELSRREKSLGHEKKRLSRREAVLTTREDTVGRAEEMLQEEKLRLEGETRDMSEQTYRTGASTNQGGAQHTPRHRRRNRSERIHVSVSGSSCGRLSSITVKFD